LWVFFKDVGGNTEYSNTSGVQIRIMVFNATFNNISVIPWQSVLLVEETRVPGKKH
jgi:hypothetical protein